jgi:hypothetical protein
LFKIIVVFGFGGRLLALQALISSLLILLYYSSPNLALSLAVCGNFVLVFFVLLFVPWRRIFYL